MCSPLILKDMFLSKSKDESVSASASVLLGLKSKSYDAATWYDDFDVVRKYVAAVIVVIRNSDIFIIEERIVFGEGDHGGAEDEMKIVNVNFKRR